MSVAPEDLEVSEILWLLGERQKKSAGRAFYKPLDAERRAVIWPYYAEQLPAWAQGEKDAQATCPLVNSVGTLICRDYVRVVIGDYGAFIEFTPEQAEWATLRLGCGGAKYNWCRTNDSAETKIYDQIATVAYADYRPNHFYVAPRDVQPREADKQNRLSGEK